MNCCNNVSIKEEFQTFKNGIKHLKQTCRNCNKFLGYKQQELTNDWIFPFGKYKGFKPANVPNSYLVWLLKQNIKENLRKYLEGEVAKTNKQ